MIFYMRHRTAHDRDLDATGATQNNVIALGSGWVSFVYATKLGSCVIAEGRKQDDQSTISLRQAPGPNPT